MLGLRSTGERLSSAHFAMSLIYNLVKSLMFPTFFTRVQPSRVYL